MKIKQEKGGIIAWHGTDRMDFASFDVSCAAPYNVGLHFGTHAAALDRIAYFREQDPECRAARLFKCRLDIRNPYRIADAFGHSYAMILDVLQEEIGRSTPTNSPLRSKIDELIDDYMSIDDDPQRASDTEAYLPYCRRLNAEIIRLFQSLGFDGLVYENELEDGEGAADSYVVFDVKQITILAANLSQGKAA